MTQPRLITFSEHYRTGIRLLPLRYPSEHFPSDSMLSPHCGWVTGSGWRITECCLDCLSAHSAAGPGSELVLYTLAPLTPVTACDQQQVLPIPRSVLTNEGPVFPENDQSETRTAALYIWVPYGHASHWMILATFILTWWMSSKGLSNDVETFTFQISCRFCPNCSAYGLLHNAK